MVALRLREVLESSSQSHALSWQQLRTNKVIKLQVRLVDSAYIFAELLAQTCDDSVMLCGDIRHTIGGSQVMTKRFPRQPSQFVEKDIKFLQNPHHRKAILQ